MKLRFEAQIKNTCAMRISVFLAALIVIFILIISEAAAFSSVSGGIGLLTVSESANNTETGGTAYMQLIISPGTGQIFIDTYPISKTDTQITTRIATEEACSFLGIDCSHYDFYYTIHADSALVGGPSAGAATAVLATALLDGQHLSNNTIMTGTINSGYIIGPVAGVPQKTEAAQQSGYMQVLVPSLGIEEDNNSANSSNSSGNSSVYGPVSPEMLSGANRIGMNQTIRIVPVSTLSDALYYFTGKNYSEDSQIQIDASSYNNVMRQITIDLCSKYGSYVDGKILMPNMSQYTIAGAQSGNPVVEGIYNATNITGNLSVDTVSNNTSGNIDPFQLAIPALVNDSYYSAASFCFSGDVQVRSAMMRNMTSQELSTQYLKLKDNITRFSASISDYNISTIPELETYMIVRDRLSDARESFDAIDSANISYSDLAYAEERFYTAVAWSKFSSLPGRSFNRDAVALSESCTNELMQAEERVNYLELYISRPQIRKEIDKAYGYRLNQDYIMCIFDAQKAKADENSVISALFMPEADIPMLVSEKLLAAKNEILLQQSQGDFPIIGYSYYVYSQSLRANDIYSALSYSQDAFDLSNLDVYTASHEVSDLHGISYAPAIHYYSSYTYPVLLGIIIGAIISVVLFLILLFITGRTIKQESRQKNLREMHRKRK